jgi:hypothetical protein
MNGPSIRDSRPITSTLARLRAEGTILSGRLLCTGRGSDLMCWVEIVALGEDNADRAVQIRSAVRTALRHERMAINVRFDQIEGE